MVFMLTKALLEAGYVKNGQSVACLARSLGISQGQVNYWLAKHGIQKRSISDAVYQKWNPNGDPFTCARPKDTGSALLFGLGIGLYWGEGTKRAPSSVRLGNSDPALIQVFILFLTRLFMIDPKKLRFGLQIFGDMNERVEKRFWSRKLSVPASSFYKTIITPYRGVGNYRHKTKHGVLTVYFNNKKLRDILVDAIAQMSDGSAEIAQLVEHVLGGSQSPAQPKRRR